MNVAAAGLLHCCISSGIVVLPLTDRSNASGRGTGAWLIHRQTRAAGRLRQICTSHAGVGRSAN